MFSACGDSLMPRLGNMSRGDNRVRRNLSPAEGMFGPKAAVSIKTNKSLSFLRVPELLLTICLSSYFLTSKNTRYTQTLNDG